MKNTVVNLMFLAAVFLVITFFVSAIPLSKTDDRIKLPDKIELQGQYSVDGAEWKQITNDAFLSLTGLHTIKIRGNFSKDIYEWQSLILYINNLYLKLNINGENIYNFGDSNLKSFFPTPGIALEDVSLGYVPRDSDVELTIVSAFNNAVSGAATLLNSMSIGHREQLYGKLLQINRSLLFGGICCIIIGTLIILLSLSIRLLHIPYALKSVALGIFIITIGMWILFSADNSCLPILFPRPKLASAINIISLYTMSLSSVMLIYTVVSERYRRYAAVFAFLLYFMQAFLFILQLLGVVQLYEVQYMVIIFTSIVAVEYIILVIDAVKNNDNETKIATVCFIPGIFGALLECVNYYIFRFAQSYWVSISGFVVTSIALLFLFIYKIKKSNKTITRVAALERDLLQMRISTMLSQIQPHFLYNALDGIAELCCTDSRKAEKAVVEFSQFLKGNMNSLTTSETVNFEAELEHTRHYLHLEQMRFGERLNIVYDIKTVSFCIPPLTLQTLVENAVRCGVTKRPEGGTVIIASYETDDSWTVVVRDDGVGFELEAQKTHLPYWKKALCLMLLFWMWKCQG